MKRLLTSAASLFSLMAIVLAPGNSAAYSQPITHPNVLVFISFSMPKESIKAWIQQAQTIGAPVIIRGLINNSFKETLFVMNQFVGEGGGVQVDPQQFERYDIQQVPAVVLSDSVDLKNSHYSETQFDVVYGDVSLDYALMTLASARNSRSETAQQLASTLRENHL